MGKRPHDAAFCVDEHMLVKLGEVVEPILVDPFVVQAFSQCARALPSKDEWDLSNLLIDGQPVGRDTVVAWLNKAYSLVNSSSFECMTGSTTPSLLDLHQLLVFADAVGTKQFLLEAIVADLDDVRISADLAGKALELRLDRMYYFSCCALPPRFHEATTELEQRMACDFAEADKPAFLSQVVAQVEPLLYMSLKLQLPCLIQKLQSFLHSSMHAADEFPFLWPVREQIFSQRVLDCAAGSSMGKTALTKHMASDNLWDLLEPCGDVEELNEPIEFEAELKKDVLGGKKGDKVLVELKVRSFETQVSIGMHSMALQLRCGPSGP